MKRGFLGMFVLAFLLMPSCKNKQYTNRDKEHSTALKDSQAVQLNSFPLDTLNTGTVDERDVVSNLTDTIIQLEYKSGIDTLTTIIQKDYQRVEVNIPSVSTTHLEASLAAEGSGRNVRFNYIVFPDGNTDGPFSQTIKYNTKAQGDYKLIIGRNNMADGDIKGPLKISIRLF